MSYEDNKLNIPPPRFEIPMPNIIGNNSNNRIHDRAEEREYRVQSRRDKKEQKWPNALWAAISWLLYVFHTVIVIAFFVDLFKGEYDLIKHITIVSTICGTYAALAYVHNNIVRNNDDGRYG